MFPSLRIIPVFTFFITSTFNFQPVDDNSPPAPSVKSIHCTDHPSVLFVNPFLRTLPLLELCENLCLNKYVNIGALTSPELGTTVKLDEKVKTSCHRYCREDNGIGGEVGI